MPTEFTFGAGNERISINIETSKTALNENQDYKNRLESTVNLNVGAFSGAYKAEFAIPDLVLLHVRLIRAFTSLSEIVAFGNTRGDLSLAIEFNGPGRAIATGTIKPQPPQVLRGHPKAANEGHLKTGQRGSSGH